MRADLLLVGFGNVGRRLAGLLEEQRAWLSQAVDLDCRVVGITTRRHGSVFDDEGLDAVRAARAVEAGTSLQADSRPGPAGSVEAIARLSRSSAPMRVVVETTTLDIERGQPAIDHVTAALDAGCHVVTANKGPAAFAYHDLDARARGAGLSFLFEGAVMDGVPVFNLVRETLPAVRISAFRGVLNSTTNHILSALEDGEAFAPALARMQAEGIAEADPSLDVDGWDASAKAAALANVFFDARVTPHEVDRTGIGPEDAARAAGAKARGHRLRLVASGARNQRPEVKLRELPGDDLLAGLRGMANALVLDTDLLGSIAIHQLGGSLTQTAYALLSDLVTTRRRLSTPPAARARRNP